MPSGKQMGQKAADNRANQLNPNHPSYQGGTNRHNTNFNQMMKAAVNNRANQLNPPTTRATRARRSERLRLRETQQLTRDNLSD